MRRVLVNAELAALHIETAFGVLVAPATIRQWARRGAFPSHGKRGSKNCYDLDEVETYVRAMRRKAQNVAL